MPYVVSKTRLSLALSLCFFNPITINAASAEDAPQATEEIIVVTATRGNRPWLTTPAAIERVDLDEQAPGLRIDAAELLAGIAGLQVDTRYNFAQDTRITLRGFGARAAFGVRGVRLRLDGIPLSMPDGQAQVSSILLDEPASVEVLRGPMAGVYGNATGGLVEFTSQRPTVSSVRTQLGTGSANRQTLRTQLDWAGDQQAARVHYSRFTTDGDRPNSAAEREHLAARWFQEFDSGVELIARIDHNHDPELRDPLALTPAQWRENPRQTVPQAETFGTRKTIRHRQQSLTLRQNRSDNPWQISAWNGLRNVEQYLAFPGSAITASGGVVDLSRGFYGIHAQISHTFTDHWQITLGADLERQRDERLGFVNQQGIRGDLRRDETGYVTSNDAWLLSDWEFAPRWRALTGLRVSDLDFRVNDRFIVPGNPDDSGQVSYTETAWSQGLNFQWLPTLSLFAAVGESFETPTLTEMAYQNEGTGLNTELRPAQLRQYEAGARWFSSSMRLQQTVFYIDSRDDLVVDQSNDGRTTYRNAATTTRRGTELDLRWSFDDNWYLRSALTWLDARYGRTELDGNRLPGLARTQLESQLNWRPLSTDQLELFVTHRYRSRVTATDNNDVFAPSSSLWSIAARARQMHQNLSFEQWLRLENIFDSQTVGSVVVNQGSGRSFEPAPGRQWLAGITVRYDF
ncbi:MAG: TonB-dependent receptor [Idiomarina sp.]|nr:TonB-dependent receptor [Idiomarina sp.]